VISHKPPAEGEAYVNPFTKPLELLDASGRPTGIRLVKEIHVPNPKKEQDVFRGTIALVGIQGPDGQTQMVKMGGPAEVEVDIPPDGTVADTDGDGLEQAKSRMKRFTLRGIHSQLGKIVMRLTEPALGEIEETVNMTPGVLDIRPFRPEGTCRSFFDIFVEIEVAGVKYRLAKPLHMETIITHKPPSPRDRYVNPFTEPIEVLTADGQPTGFKLVREIHIPNPFGIERRPGENRLTLNVPAADTGAVLQRTRFLGGQWENVSIGAALAGEDVVRTIVIDPSADKEFYRVIIPDIPEE